MVAYLGSFSEELVSASRAGSSDSLEEFVGDAVGVDSVKGNGSGGWDDVSLGDSSQWDTVDFVWPGDQKKSGVELLDENDSSSSESSAQDNQNGSWGDRGSQSSWLRNLVGSLEWGLDVVSWIELNCAHLI